MKHKGLRLGALFCAAAMTITTSAQALSVEEAYDILRRSYVDRLPRAAKDADRSTSFSPTPITIPAT